MAGTSVRQTTVLFGAANSIVSKLMTAFEKEGKTTSLKPTLEESKSCRLGTAGLTQILQKDHKITITKITAELNNDHVNPVFSKTLRWNCTKPDIKIRKSF